MNQRQPKCYSIIPAAGRSQRMGCQKLLLPWPAQRGNSLSNQATVLDAVLSAWQESMVDDVVVVLREHETPTLDEREIIDICTKYRVHLVHAHNPPDMKASVICGMNYLTDIASPMEFDRCFVAPADLPTLHSRIIDTLAGQTQYANQSCIPFFGNRRGHPALLSWKLLNDVYDLKADEGINSIVHKSETIKIQFPKEDLVTDMDTPSEYEDLLKRFA